MTESMSPTITSGFQPSSDQRLRAAVDGDEHRPEVADVAAHDLEVALVPRPAGDDERVPVAEARLERGEVDPLREQLALVAQVAERVVGELLQRLGDASLLLEQRAGELVLLERPPGREAGAVPEEARAADGQPLAVGELVEETPGRRRRSGARRRGRAGAAPGSGSSPTATGRR